MKEELPPPEFDAGRYERPNQEWICGHAEACRIGPGPRGRCRATFECKPILEVRSGEDKGRYSCTRTAEYGGPCERGPLPDGTCCRPIPRCSPFRSLRGKRRILTLSVSTLTLAVLLAGLGGPFRDRFINPGPLSSQHATEAFAALHAGAGGDAGSGCAACHATARGGPGSWIGAALGASPGPFHFRRLAEATPPGMNGIDRACLECHAGHGFHQPNVVRDHSCSACHREHLGAGPMPAPTDANCLACHGDTDVMEASYQLGRALPHGAFDYRPDRGRVLFQAPRPERGHTTVFQSFTDGHPEFQAVSGGLADPNPLKFNHRVHLTSPTVRHADGRAPGCADCHKPEASGVFHLPITYEQNCKGCHSLQFDVNNPELLVPHGNPEFVRAFLRSLPTQYADHGAAFKGLSNPDELDAFVRLQMAAIRERHRSGEDLERQVFHADKRTAPAVRVGELDEPGRARYPGCAYCHEVTPAGEAVPVVSPPVIPDRWFIRGRFDHGKHSNVSCAKCHQAEASSETSDILLPTKATCLECHSPKGGVAHQCSTCHSFHSPRREDLIRKAGL